MNGMNEKPKSQNLSIMMTDLQGYTNASSASSREEVVALIRRHNQLMMPVIKFYGGTIIKSIGDAFLCTFQSATDAVVCAIIIQLLLKEYNTRQKDTSRRMNLRVVINTGDVSLEKNDIYGEAVNVTARMEGLACFPGGTIGISESTHLLMNRNEIVALKIGPQTLKGIPTPVTVFKVPLEKQKLMTIPARLLQLVEKVVDGSIDVSESGSGSMGDLGNEWANAVTTFLKEKNWGESVQQAGRQVGQKVGQLQDKLVSTFRQKTVLEQNVGKSLPDAGIPKRLITFAIDLVILLLLYFSLNAAWWPVQRIVFGRAAIPSSEFKTNDAYRAFSNWTTGYESGEYVYYRPMGIIEWSVNVNVKIPLFLTFLYFVFFWKIKGATLGQIAGHTAVVSENGDSISWGQSMKRSAIFVLSTLFFGLGALMIFSPEKRTLFDKVAQTRVIE
ncbi:MAG: adenylate/guanylate cyclase domain-containing protein [Candidatus Ozemobacteraceae bacterium]